MSPRTNLWYDPRPKEQALPMSHSDPIAHLSNDASGLEGPAAPRRDHEREARAEEICSRLLMDRWLQKRAYRDLLIDDDLRAIVQRRLSGVGLQLVESYTSDYFAVRLRPSVESDVGLDWAVNTRMPRGAVALLVILWAKLILPRRIADTEAALQRDAGQKEPPPPPPAPFVGREQLYAEFGRKFGKTAFARYLGNLKSAGFVREDRLGNLREGPLLDLLVDGAQMSQKLRDSVLWDLLEKGGLDAEEPDDRGKADDGDDDEF